MLTEGDIKERAIFCYCVFLQLGWLFSNDTIQADQYIGLLKKSSLGLGEDEFIVSTIQESLVMAQGEAALQSLITLYEGFTGAFCEVLEISMDDIRSGLSHDTQKKLAMEVGVDIKL